MKLSFTTLGCPGWDIATVCRQGKAYGFDGVDFRGLGDALDVTTLPEFTTKAAETKRMISDAGLEVSGFSSSISLCNAAKRKEILDEAKRTIAVALEFSSPHIRVFGGGDLKTMSREEAAKVGRDCLREILALDGARWLSWNLETHDHWVSSCDVLMLLDGVNDPAVGVLWDIGHTPRVGNETPEETYRLLGSKVRYTHLKDAVKDPAAGGDGWRYVACGEGQLPLAEAVKILKKGGYDGYLTLEHEKRWHKELPEPEEVFPKYVAWGRRVIAGS